MLQSEPATTTTTATVAATTIAMHGRQVAALSSLSLNSQPVTTTTTTTTVVHGSSLSLLTAWPSRDSLSDQSPAALAGAPPWKYLHVRSVPRNVSRAHSAADQLNCVWDFTRRSHPQLPKTAFWDQNSDCVFSGFCFPCLCLHYLSFGLLETLCFPLFNLL